MEKNIYLVSVNGRSDYIRSKRTPLAMKGVEKQLKKIHTGYVSISRVGRTMD
jgi:hypothetical protein